ncbi:respiratory growth induced protein 1 [[Candida] anglica]|uniref:Respiratory growth induced protein 1 n=1 Tax=[Candida] anglica TaxID=148631 RepID=A0ABP0EHC9_9ASCO
MTKKNKNTSIPLNLSNCERMQALREAPDRTGTPPPLREFDDLNAFETFVRDETWDNEFDNFHAHLTYYPPFVLQEVHDDLEKIKPTMNKNSKKFKRNLQHHIKRHLMTELETVAGYPMDFGKCEIEEDFNTWKLKFVDQGLHGFTEEEEERLHRHWRIEMEVKANRENPLVEVDIKSLPF